MKALSTELKKTNDIIEGSRSLLSCGDEAASLQSAVSLTDAGMFLAAELEGNRIMCDEARVQGSLTVFTA